jgi:hypothetical protein
MQIFGGEPKLLPPQPLSELGRQAEPPGSTPPGSVADYSLPWAPSPRSVTDQPAFLAQGGSSPRQPPARCHRRPRPLRASDSDDHQTTRTLTDLRQIQNSLPQPHLGCSTLHLGCRLPPFKGYFKGLSLLRSLQAEERPPALKTPQ